MIFEVQSLNSLDKSKKSKCIQKQVRFIPQPVKSTLENLKKSPTQQKQKAISFNAFPCEKDQQLYIQTG